MKKTVLAAALIAATSAAHAITIEFDYSYDSNNFLTGNYRSVLNAVATEFGSRITDALDAASYSTISFNDPGADLSSGIWPKITLSNQQISADTLHIYVGGTDLGGNTLGIGGSGGYSAFSSVDRGQSGVGTSDYAPWGGFISFDTLTNWYVDTDTATDESFSGFDFYSVAVHELGHVLGIGVADSWSAQVTGAGFAGTDSVAAYSEATGNAESSVPLSADGGHWANGTQSFVNGILQDASLDPSIANGQRKRFTDLDWAALSDVGWQVTAVPEAQTWAMMLAGLGLLGWARRRRA
ncbi:matrixin family metalloprotease [Nitrogeniibacter mangrovi]|uniref:Matrixin family metalloprotease n=1 Tax=Nitrogeniibacter mangrovi TaxID=2016596 RepID=A0A6C1AZF6_9RHOO|nr:PEP-CTERM sorting domain-containing protein [Nitrogeniibacter mangrovi]QID16751.1 matrixin family metalloprotease [Nitrogeniibacter mangrovi]